MPTLPMKIPWWSSYRRRKALNLLRERRLDRIGSMSEVWIQNELQDDFGVVIILSAPDKQTRVLVRCLSDDWTVRLLASSLWRIGRTKWKD